MAGKKSLPFLAASECSLYSNPGIYFIYSMIKTFILVGAKYGYHETYIWSF